MKLFNACKHGAFQCLPVVVLGLTLVAVIAWTAPAAEPRATEAVVTNSLGMKLVRIAAGTFRMGSEDGEFDERPVHEVTLTQPFFIGATEVTNAQYEQFDREHKELRGKRKLSNGDDEAVVFVSWNEAVAFCQWLSQKEGKPYRLPTEAEWEYACRAGTTSAYSTGRQFPKERYKNQKFVWQPEPVSLAVGQASANPWGLFDMHGNVEEWCSDWYGPYVSGPRTDSVGRATGAMKVSRGGSHNTDVVFLRSANRQGTLPDDKNWLIGFRVVQAPSPTTAGVASPDLPRWARNVSQRPWSWTGGPDPAKPLFRGPRRFVHIPADSTGPMYSRHNHCPSITACPNGDLLAVWFSTNSEAGREMTIVASRLRQGSDAWEPADEFFKAPDRNMTGSSLWWDGQQTLLHCNGLEVAGGWGNLALVLRTSTDNGVTWQTRLIEPEHQPRNQVIHGMLRTKEGFLIQACDATRGGNGGSALHISRDGGKTWTDPTARAPAPVFQAGKVGGNIAGIHAGVVQLTDGRLMALGRGDAIEGRMPMSLSSDMGNRWTYSASPMPTIGGGQRLVLMRLREGPLLLCSFADNSKNLRNPRGITVTDAAGQKRTVYGLVASVSLDEGKTWPMQRPVTAGGAPQHLDGGAWTAKFTMDDEHAEPRGYLAATQTPDGVIHLISSALHYEFNLAWLKSPMPAKR